MQHEDAAVDLTRLTRIPSQAGVGVGVGMLVTERNLTVATVSGCMPGCMPEKTANLRHQGQSSRLTIVAVFSADQS